MSIRFISLLGMTCSISVVLLGASNWLILWTIFLCYASLAGGGQQEWYSSWTIADSLLLAVVFWTIFMVPIWSLHQRPEQVPMPIMGILGLKFVLFYLALDDAWSRIIVG